MNPAWLDWAQRLQAIAQNGLTFSHDHFDIERYQQLRQIAAEILASYSSADLRVVHDLFAQGAGYATPKVDVRGAVFKHDAILLVKERSDGGWTLPGGWADIGDSPSVAVEREIAEESGYQARAVKLLAVYDRNKHDHPPIPDHAYKLFFLCELVGGEPTIGAETDGVGFFRENELPELSVMRVTRAQIARLFEHSRHPGWPADFD